MKLAIIGSVALDSLETPFGRRRRAIGGSAVHAAVAASFFVKKPAVVGVVGKDFPVTYEKLLKKRGIDLTDLEHAAGRTFHWQGRYAGDMAVAQTLKTELGVFAAFEPKLSAAAKRAPFLFLANIDPDLQDRVIDAMAVRPKFILLDTMNLWIQIKKSSLKKVLRRVDGAVLNDQEIRQLTGIQSLIQAARKVLTMGPRIVLLKRGEHGASLISRNEYFHLPAYPTDKVKDPTGAGDSFAGGLMGCLAESGSVAPRLLRRAMAAGTVMASFQVEGFSLERTMKLKSSEIQKRMSALKQMVSF